MKNNKICLLTWKIHVPVLFFSFLPIKQNDTHTKKFGFFISGMALPSQQPSNNHIVSTVARYTAGKDRKIKKPIRR